VEVLGEGGRVRGVRVEANRLVATATGFMRSEGTGRMEDVRAGLVLRSVGYRGVPLPGVPFDPERGLIPNIEGRVTDGPGGEVVPGEFVAGWIKRGPSGIIGTNKPDAAETVASMLEEVEAGRTRSPASPEPSAVEELLESRGVRFVTFSDWRRLDEAEVAAGTPFGRPRVKVVHVDRMLEIMER
jgi:ferredoxin--NADP+ reductase